MSLATFTPTSNHAPHRVKVSADFGAINADINSAASAGQTLTGPSRTFSDPANGVLFNVNVPDAGRMLVEVLISGVWVGVGLLRVAAGGSTGFVLTPNGHGHPAGYTSYRSVFVAGAAGAASVVVTSQPFSY